MAGPADLGRVASDLAVALDHGSGLPVHRIAQLPAAIVPVHNTAQPVARLGIGGAGLSYRASRKRDPERRALQNGQRVAHGETQPRIEAERAVVITRLHEADAWG